MFLYNIKCEYTMARQHSWMYNHGEATKWVIEGTAPLQNNFGDEKSNENKKWELDNNVILEKWEAYTLSFVGFFCFFFPSGNCASACQWNYWQCEADPVWSFIELHVTGKWIILQNSSMNSVLTAITTKSPNMWKISISSLCLYMSLVYVVKSQRNGIWCLFLFHH